MYQVVSAAQMAGMESRAYAQGCDETQFMEEAGLGIFRFVKERASEVILLCGKGNNGGDAYVAGYHLLTKGISVRAIQVGSSEECSPLNIKNRERFAAEGGSIVEVHGEEVLDFSTKTERAVILDGLFGTGFKGTPREPYASVIEQANASGLPIVAVDIPSGLNGDTGSVSGAAIKAKITIFLGLPKKGFFLDQGWNHIGKLVAVDFGLPKKIVDEEAVRLRMFTEDDFPPLMPSIQANRHKYQAGYVVGLAGSPGMPGAANLSSTSALRGGAGIVRLLYPRGMEAELSASLYELVKKPYDYDDIDPVIEQLNQAAAVFIGPGLGVNDQTRGLLTQVLAKLTVPAVVDADALTIIAELNLPLPANVVLTPHLGEMRRLLHSSEKTNVDEAFLEVCQQYVDSQQVTLVLKGGPSFVLRPSEEIVVVPYGDPGMATAGSGDVLTGLTAALLAQKLTPGAAAMVAVFIHAYAGECAAARKTSYCMIASDIIKNFPNVFTLLC